MAPASLPAAAAQSALDHLRAQGPHPGLARELATFGQFVGEWDLDVKFFDEAGSVIYRQPHLWCFSWILGGRAIQDVLVGPAPVEAPHEPRLGTTLRQFDPALGRWRVLWMNAAGHTFIPLEGGPEGADILLTGRDMDGSALRWRFSDITPDSFTWRGQTSRDGQHWRLEQEMFATRRGVGG